jgi:Na+-driven multidrug efflux pump
MSYHIMVYNKSTVNLFVTKLFYKNDVPMFSMGNSNYPLASRFLRILMLNNVIILMFDLIKNLLRFYRRFQ